jgi:hypothetical protein
MSQITVIDRDLWWDVMDSWLRLFLFILLGVEIVGRPQGRLMHQTSYSVIIRDAQFCNTVSLTCLTLTLFRGFR